MINVNSEIRRGVEKHFDTNWNVTSIQYTNSELDTESLDEYIALSFDTIAGGQNTLGLTVNHGETHDLLLTVQIYTKKGVGTGRAEEIADELLSIINRAKVLIVSDNQGNKGRIQFSVPESMQYNSTDQYGWVRHDVDVEFRLRI